MVDIRAETFVKNCIHTISQIKIIFDLVDKKRQI